jgi:predicted PurR-regulated permease PerM
MLLGRRLILNPVVIFMGIIFWGWLWGIPGALLAVPILVSFKIFCDHIGPLSPIGEFLGR